MRLTKTLATFLTIASATVSSIPLLKRGHHTPNCKGSSLCKKIHDGSVIWELHDVISRKIEEDSEEEQRFYNWGELIACRWVDDVPRAFCAFYQAGQKHNDEQAGTLEEAQAYLEQMMDMDCETCGSIPYDGSERAEFTVNYVTMLAVDAETTCGKPHKAEVCTGENLWATR